MRGKLALIIAIMLGAVASFGIYSYLKDISDEQVIREVDIVVAAERIRSGDEIRADMLKPMRFPEAALARDHILWRDYPTLVRQRIGRNVEINEAILRTYMFEVRPEVGAILPPGHVAITIRVDDVTGVAGTLQPGSHVDVIATMPTAPEERGASGEVTSWRLLNNCRIIAVDSRTVQAMPTTGQFGRSGSPYTSVTLAVVPDESVLLTYVQSQGRISLALRNETDPSEPQEPPEIRLQNVRSQSERINQERKRRLAAGE